MRSRVRAPSSPPASQLTANESLIAKQQNSHYPDQSTEVEVHLYFGSVGKGLILYLEHMLKKHAAPSSDFLIRAYKYLGIRRLPLVNRTTYFGCTKTVPKTYAQKTGAERPL